MLQITLLNHIPVSFKAPAVVVRTAVPSTAAGDQTANVKAVAATGTTTQVLLFSATSGCLSTHFELIESSAFLKRLRLSCRRPQKQGTGSLRNG